MFVEVQFISNSAQRDRVVNTWRDGVETHVTKCHVYAGKRGTV